MHSSSPPRVLACGRGIQGCGWEVRAAAASADTLAQLASPYRSEAIPEQLRHIRNRHSAQLPAACLGAVVLRAAQRGGHIRGIGVVQLVHESGAPGQIWGGQARQAHSLWSGLEIGSGGSQVAN